MRQHPEEYVSTRPLHFALREWRAHVAAPKALALMACVAGTLALVGPFGTDEVLRLVPRFVYWFCLVVLCYSVGFLSSAIVRHTFDGTSVWLIRLLVCFLTGTGVAAVVTLANLSVFGILPDRDTALSFLLTVYGVAALVALGFEIASDTPPQSASASPHPSDQLAHPTSAPILDRLPLDKRGTLFALSVEDHYVRVRTSQGEDLILMRLADAIRETRADDGLQVHRSHWVATAAVKAARREGDRAILTLLDDSEVPVSRRYLPAIREAGLLPR